MGKRLTMTQQWELDHPDDVPCPEDHSGAIKWRRERLIGASYRDLDRIRVKMATKVETRARYGEAMAWRAVLAQRAAIPKKAKKTRSKPLGFSFTQFVIRAVRRQMLEREMIEKLKPNTVIGNPGGESASEK